MEIASFTQPLRVLRRSVCSSCLRQMQRQSLHTSSRLRQDSRSSRPWIAKEGEQAFPSAGYYGEILSSPLHVTAGTTRTATSNAPAPSPEQVPPPMPAKRAARDSSEREEIMARAKMVFGSRLAGPIQRRKEIMEKSTTIAGVVVPPRPGEPDNCCMSGCVNCVWDQYRDELEEWAAQSALARAALEKQQKAQGKSKSRTPKPRPTIPGATGSMLAGEGTPSHVAVSMDDDGGGSDTNWNFGTSTGGQPGSGEDLFGGIPVGIREFMKTEKMLKNRHAAERASAGR